MSKREKRREWEAEYVSEYIQKFWPKRLYILHFRVTGPPKPALQEELSYEEVRMLRVFARWVDAVIMVPPVLYIVEAKLRASEYIKALGELLYYLEAIKRNPEINWKEFKEVYPIKGIESYQRQFYLACFLLYQIQLEQVVAIH